MRDVERIDELIAMLQTTQPEAYQLRAIYEVALQLAKLVEQIETLDDTMRDLEGKRR